jgi:hypothetical protein
VGGGKPFFFSSATSQHGNAPAPALRSAAALLIAPLKHGTVKGVYPRIPIQHGRERHFFGLRQSQANRQQIFRKPEHRTDDTTQSPPSLQLVPHSVDVTGGYLLQHSCVGQTTKAGQRQSSVGAPAHTPTPTCLADPTDLATARPRVLQTTRTASHLASTGRYFLSWDSVAPTHRPRGSVGAAHGGRTTTDRPTTTPAAPLPRAPTALLRHTQRRVFQSPLEPSAHHHSPINQSAQICHTRPAL